MKVLSFALLLGTALVPGVTCANSAEHVKVNQAWLRILPGDLPAAGYAALQNTSKEPVALTGARSTFYADVMLHLSSSAGGRIAASNAKRFSGCRVISTAASLSYTSSRKPPFCARSARYSGR